MKKNKQKQNKQKHEVMLACFDRAREIVSEENLELSFCVSVTGNIFSSFALCLTSLCPGMKLKRIELEM